jgi:hypothetical protein
MADRDEAALSADLPPGPVLRVACRDGLVTIVARRQTLAAILYAVAEKAGIPFSLKADVGATMDLDRTALPLEQLPDGLPAGVHVVARKSLQAASLRAVRIELVKSR